MLTYRQALPQDTNQLQRLTQEYCVEAGLSYTTESIALYIQNSLSNTYMLVAEKEGTLVGALSFLLTSHSFSGVSCAKKIGWFVSKEHRGRIGIELLKQAESLAKGMGAKHFYCSLPTKMVTDYMPVETEYVKDLI